MVVTVEKVPKNQTESNSTNSGGLTSTQKKKKRPNRQRNRPRNKRNRAQNASSENTENQVEDAKSSSESSSDLANNIVKKPETVTVTAPAEMKDNATQSAEVENVKTREQILAEREAKKLAKQAKKLAKPGDVAKVGLVATKTVTSEKANNLENACKPTQEVASTTNGNTQPLESNEKNRDQIKAEREAKKAAKQAAKTSKSTSANVTSETQQMANPKLSPNVVIPTTVEVQEKKKPTLTKAERRAIQEAQRAAKAKSQKPEPAVKTNAAITKSSTTTTTSSQNTKGNKTSPIKSPSMSPAKSVSSNAEQDCKVKLFNHLEHVHNDVRLFINDPLLHPSIARLGEQYAKRTIVGSNARCIAFLNALNQVVQDFVTPVKKEFTRSLEAAVKHHVDHLHKCRPLAVSVCNAYKQFKNQLLQLPADKPESDLKETLSHFIDTYIENQIGKAALAISSSLQEKITDGDVLLTFGCSSLIHYICEEAKRRNVDFRVIVVDSRPYLEGQELLRRLTAKGIPCTYVLINAISFVMSEATKVLLGAHALLSNGYVMARTGTAQVALVAHSHNVPVLVCCETHKFSERFQTDAIVYNELGNPDDLIANDKCSLTNWQAKSKMTPLNLNYDITPPELVTAVVTEVSILPCTSVPVILRIKPDIGY